MDAILKMIQDSANLDLSHYKKSSIERSVNRRMHARDIQSLPGYVSLLETDPQELHALVSDVTVDFSLFFRDEKLFDLLKDSVLPELIRQSRAGAGRPVRAWCAGCGAGEEAYSVAILLFEALKGSAGRERVTIFATDVDPASLAKSRAAAYSEESARDIPHTVLERYFSLDGGYRIKSFIKDLICFGRHNLISDPPISRIDLLLCRNVLIYLDKEGQLVVLRRLRYAVRPGGYLVLGKSESLPRDIGDSFEVVDRTLKIFRRKDDDKCIFPYS